MYLIDTSTGKVKKYSTLLMKKAKGGGYASVMGNLMVKATQFSPITSKTVQHFQIS